MAALRASLLEGATAERMKALGEKLHEAALGGDWTAAKLLLAYALGKPPQAVDADRLDLDEWRLLDAGPTLAQVLRAFIEGIDPEWATEFYRRRELLGAKARIQDKLRDARNYTGGPEVEGERKARIGKRP
jgi:hypothetical protein